MGGGRLMESKSLYEYRFLSPALATPPMEHIQVFSKAGLTFR